jgi:DNA-binding response OmpR family regulator
MNRDAGMVMPLHCRRPLSVLVVDSYRDAAESVGQVLTLAGHRVRVAFNADSAVQAVSEDRPDVIITETRLRGPTGYDLVDRISALPGSRPYLIALTSQGGREDRLRVLAAGFDRFILKPADPTVLVNFLGSGLAAT